MLNRLSHLFFGGSSIAAIQLIHGLDWSSLAQAVAQVIVAVGTVLAMLKSKKKSK